MPVAGRRRVLLAVLLWVICVADRPAGTAAPADVGAPIAPLQEQLLATSLEQLAGEVSRRGGLARASRSCSLRAARPTGTGGCWPVVD